MKKIRGILDFNGFTVAGVNKGSCVLSIIFLPDGGGAAAGLGLDQAGKQMKHAAVHLQAFVRLGYREKLFPWVFVSFVGGDLLQAGVCDGQEG